MSDLTAVPPRRSPYEDIRLLIGRMDGKLDIVLATTVDQGRRLTELEAWRHRQDSLPVTLKDHEQRIDAMDAWKNRWLGWTLATSFAGGATAERLINLIFN